MGWPSASRPLLGALLLSLLPAFALAQPVERRPLTGWVRNLIGEGVPGVEVLIFPSGRDSLPLPPGVRRTDEQGRFDLEGLEPGRYVLGFNKPGYQILLAQVNTRVQSLFILTLLPGTAAFRPPSLPEPGSMDWVLRAPRTDVLKEWRGGGGLDGDGGEDSVPVAVHPPFLVQRTGSGTGERLARLPVNGEIQQWFTSDVPFVARGPDSAASTGRTTAVDVSGNLGDHGEWKVGGLAGNLVTEPDEPEEEAAVQDRGANRLRVGMRYELSPDDSLRFQARYDRDRFRNENFGFAPGPSAQDVRTSGYQADWSRRTGGGKGLTMRLGFLQALGRVPDRALLEESFVDFPDDSALQDRVWNAGASYDFNLTRAHRLTLRTSTRIYRYDQRDRGWILAPVQPAVSLAEAGENGWSISVSGEDAWKLSNPLTLTLGLDYHRADSLQGFSTVVPRFGASLEGERSVLRGELLVRLHSSADLPADETTPPAAGFRAENRPGFRAEVVQKVGRNWSLDGHAERSPLEFGEDRLAWEPKVHPVHPGVLFFVDPTAATQEVGVRVRKRFRGVEGGLETERGKVSGRVAARLDETPIQALADGEVRYWTLKASAAVKQTDTEVRMDYSRLSETDLGNSRDAPLDSSRVDVMVLQQIPSPTRFGSADWKILFACQTINRDSSPSPTGSGSDSPEHIRRISGGVGVTF